MQAIAQEVKQAKEAADFEVAQRAAEEEWREAKRLEADQEAADYVLAHRLNVRH